MFLLIDSVYNFRITQILNVFIRFFQHDKKKRIEPVYRCTDSKQHLIPEIPVTIMGKFMIKDQFSFFCGISGCRKIQLCMKKSGKKRCGKACVLPELWYSAYLPSPTCLSVHLNTHRITYRQTHPLQFLHGETICQQFSCQFKCRHAQPDGNKNHSHNFHPFI